MNDKMFNDFKAREKELMDEYGFVIHNVFPDSNDGSLWSHHTHGLKENFGHMDLEIVLPINPNIANAVLHGMVECIKEGECYENKLISDKVIRDYEVQLIKVHDENGRELLRVILPDANGKFPSDKDCADVYKNQLDDLDFCQNN